MQNAQRQRLLHAIPRPLRGLFGGEVDEYVARKLRTSTIKADNTAATLFQVPRLAAHVSTVARICKSCGCAPMCRRLPLLAYGALPRRRESVEGLNRFLEVVPQMFPRSAARRRLLHRTRLKLRMWPCDNQGIAAAGLPRRIHSGFMASSCRTSVEAEADLKNNR